MYNFSIKAALLLFLCSLDYTGAEQLINQQNSSKANTVCEEEEVIPPVIGNKATNRYAIRLYMLTILAPANKQMLDREIKDFVEDSFNYFLESHITGSHSCDEVDSGIRRLYSAIKMDGNMELLLELVKNPLQINADATAYEFYRKVGRHKHCYNLNKDNYQQVIDQYFQFLEIRPVKDKGQEHRRFTRRMNLRDSSSSVKLKFVIPECVENDAARYFTTFLYFINHNEILFSNLVRSFFVDSFDYFVESRYISKHKSDKIDLAIKNTYSQLILIEKLKPLIEKNLNNPLGAIYSNKSFTHTAGGLFENFEITDANYEQLKKEFVEFIK